MCARFPAFVSCHTNRDGLDTTAVFCNSSLISINNPKIEFPVSSSFTLVVSISSSTTLVLLCLIDEKMLVVPCFPMDFAGEGDIAGVQTGKWIHKYMRIKTWLRLSSGSLSLGCSLSTYLRHSTILRKIPGNNHSYSRFPGSNHSKSRCSIKLKAWLYKNPFTKHTWLCVWLLQVKGLEFNVVFVQDSNRVHQYIQYIHISTNDRFY